MLDRGHSKGRFVCAITIKVVDIFCRKMSKKNNLNMRIKCVKFYKMFRKMRKIINFPVGKQYS